MIHYDCSSSLAPTRTLGTNYNSITRAQREHGSCLEFAWVVPKITGTFVTHSRVRVWCYTNSLPFNVYTWFPFPFSFFFVYSLVKCGILIWRKMVQTKSRSAKWSAQEEEDSSVPSLLSSQSSIRAVAAVVVESTWINDQWTLERMFNYAKVVHSFEHTHSQGEWGKFDYIYFNNWPFLWSPLTRTCIIIVVSTRQHSTWLACKKSLSKRRKGNQFFLVRVWKTQIKKGKPKLCFSIFLQ